MPRFLVIAWLVGIASCAYPPLPVVDDATNGGACSASTDCKNTNFPVCDTAKAGGTCVQCTDANHSACQNPTPACVNDVCAKCTQHSQCASQACMPDGTCGDAAMIAYVTSNGSGTACTQMAPCKTLSDAINAKQIVKIAMGMIADDSNNPTTIDNNAVTILADSGAKITRTKAGTILEVKNNQADVRIYDLEIANETGTKTDPAVSIFGGQPKLTLTRVKIDNNVGNGVAITAGTLTVAQSILSDNGANGILASNCTVNVTGSTVSRNAEIGILLSASAKGNVAQSTINNNSGGGISINNSEFDITNNFITGNGTSGGMFGGVLLNMTNIGTRKFQFNTVTDNTAVLATGVSCTGIDSDKVLTLSNSIVFDNQIGGGRLQVNGANCQWTYSDIGDSITPAQSPIPGTGNIVADPMFVAPTSPTKRDYRLKPASPAKNVADPAATLNVDVEGTPRPQEGRCDMGADEYMAGQ